MQDARPLKARIGSTEEVDAALSKELGISPGQLHIMKLAASTIGIDRIQTLPSQQLDAEFELELERTHPGIKGGGVAGLRFASMIDRDRELQLRGRNVLRRIAELYTY